MLWSSRSSLCTCMIRFSLHVCRPGDLSIRGLHVGGEGGCSCCDRCGAFPSLSTAAFSGSCSTCLSLGVWVVGHGSLRGSFQLVGQKFHHRAAGTALSLCGQVVMHRASGVVCGVMLGVCSPACLLSLISLQLRLPMRASLIAPCALLSLISLGVCRHLGAASPACASHSINQSPAHDLESRPLASSALLLVPSGRRCRIARMRPGRGIPSEAEGSSSAMWARSPAALQLGSSLSAWITADQTDRHSCSFCLLTVLRAPSNPLCKPLLQPCPSPPR